MNLNYVTVIIFDFSLCFDTLGRHSPTVRIACHHRGVATFHSAFYAQQFDINEVQLPLLSLMLLLLLLGHPFGVLRCFCLTNRRQLKVLTRSRNLVSISGSFSVFVSLGGFS